MNSCKKGAEGERELARLLREHGHETQRGGTLSFGEMPDLYGLDGIHIECKRVERLNISEAMRQAERDAERFGDGAPTVFHRRNREPWLVTMRFEDWIRIYEKLRTEKSGSLNNEPPKFSEQGNGSAEAAANCEEIYPTF